ncbi:hypothetical protein NUW54_g4551 [Trametes sanguinea]|uniref:Uncharacterized protein n=1 Tax=Trametes sanguinea TaxID=158606 RepID=A0ACC1PY69_9APHY|nr:hypothetical protein NUW54_g4551 [Trametes sanguinea]
MSKPNAIQSAERCIPKCRRTRQSRDEAIVSRQAAPADSGRVQRARVPSRKQAELDQDKRLTLDKQLDETLSKWKKLKKMAKLLDRHDIGGPLESSSSESEGPESEEEDETVGAQKKHRSAFESRGIFEAPKPTGNSNKRLRRAGEPPIRHEPVSEPGSEAQVAASQRQSSPAVPLSGSVPTSTAPSRRD